MKKNTYIPIAYNFWNLVLNAITEMDKQGNKTFIMSEYVEEESFEESFIKYQAKTNWNDNNIGIPILFNFYHGLELFMKGLLEVEGVLENKGSHSLTNLYKCIKENESIYTKELIDLLKYHLYSVNDYNPFFNTNKISVDKFYDALKYPESRDGIKQYSFYSIRGKQQVSFKIYETIKEAIGHFRMAIENWKKN